jgi:charged multivesicular body protein 6
MGSWLAALRGGRRRNDEPPQQTGPSRITEQDKAVLNLKKSRDKLQQYQKKIADQLVKERDIAKRLLRDGKKEKAKLLLKKKRFLEGLLANTDTQLENLQQMVDTIEFTQIEVKVVEGLKQGNEALNQLHKIMSLVDVEKIMDETQEAVEYQREIDELLGQNLTAEDEDAIAAELESIIAAQLPSVPSQPVDQISVEDLPEVPTEDPRGKELLSLP